MKIWMWTRPVRSIETAPPPSSGSSVSGWHTPSRGGAVNSMLRSNTRGAYGCGVSAAVYPDSDVLITFHSLIDRHGEHVHSVIGEDHAGGLAIPLRQVASDDVGDLDLPVVTKNLDVEQ